MRCVHAELAHISKLLNFLQLYKVTSTLAVKKKNPEKRKRTSFNLITQVPKLKIKHKLNNFLVRTLHLNFGRKGRSAEVSLALRWLSLLTTR